MVKTEIPQKLRGFNFTLIGKEKRPFEKSWQSITRRFSDPYFQRTLESGKNYGVQMNKSFVNIDGVDRHLIVIDFDTKEFQDKVLDQFPETFTTTSGSKKNCLHLWFASDNNKAFKIHDNEGNTFADIIGAGNQVIAPGSKHESGSIYSVVKDIPIAFLPYEQAEKILKPYDEKPKKEKKPIKPYIPKDNEDVGDRAVGSISMEEILSELGIDTNKKLTGCYFHSSVGGKCMGWDDETAHCFHCDGAWNKFSLVRDAMNINDKETFEWFAEKSGLSEELKQARKDYAKDNKVSRKNKGEVELGVGIKRIPIELPGNGKLISTFADELAEEVKDKQMFFYRSDTRSIIEIGKIRHANGEVSYNGFIEMNGNRFVTLIEKHFSPWAEIFMKNGESLEIIKSMPTSTANIVLVSDNFRDKLPVINRMFTVPIPIIYEEKLTFPKKGYDKRFGSWLPNDSPEISIPNLELGKAKEIIKELLCEFCFLSRQDYVNAVAGLLTPFLRGLYSSFTKRTPFYIYEANRERAGKDYLAGLNGILYEGHALEEPPISNNEKSTGRNDELRKKLLGAMIQGRTRLHFANNKGYLNNAVLEAILTAEKFSDRLLGKNEIATLMNELELSGSGNVGLTLTPDLANRSRFIRLFLEVEDANSRKFQNPNLHGWLKENRELVLSALYSLVRNWIDKEKPKGSLPFASYPEWADICGGIMECAGLGNPCVQDESSSGVAIDTETADMKGLFEYCYMKSPDKFLTKKQIIEYIQECQKAEEDELFSYLDFTQRADQTKFGLKLIKYKGRLQSEIKLIVKDDKIRASRWKYKFSKTNETYNRDDIFGENDEEEEEEEIGSESTKIKPNNLFRNSDYFTTLFRGYHYFRESMRGIIQLGNLGNVCYHLETSSRNKSLKECPISYHRYQGYHPNHPTPTLKRGGGK